jgi:hypothetical protein
VSVLRDYLGNALEPGDYFVYAALRNKSVGMRVARVLATEGGLKILAAERSWRSGWSLLRGRPDPQQSVRIARAYVPSEVRVLLDDPDVDPKQTELPLETP